MNIFKRVWTLILSLTLCLGMGGDIVISDGPLSK